MSSHVKRQLQILFVIISACCISLQSKQLLLCKTYHRQWSPQAENHAIYFLKRVFGNSRMQWVGLTAPRVTTQCCPKLSWIYSEHHSVTTDRSPFPTESPHAFHLIKISAFDLKIPGAPTITVRTEVLKPFTYFPPISTAAELWQRASDCSIWWPGTLRTAETPSFPGEGIMK